MESEKDSRITLALEGKSGTGKMYLTSLTDEEIRYTEIFSEGIDVTDTMMVLQYGSEAQRKVMRFTESSLFGVPVTDYNEIGEDIRKLLDKQAQFVRSFEHAGNITQNNEKSYEAFKSMYDRFSAVLTETARRLEIHRSSLLRHIGLIDKLYEKCLLNIREFDMYLYAGERCLETSRNGKLKELAQKAAESGFMEDTILVNDYKDACVLFEKRLADLSVSRQLPLEIMAQIRLIQQTDRIMADNLRYLTADTFSLYRSRIVLSLGLSDTEDAGGKIIDPAVFNDANADLAKALNVVLKVKADDLEKQRKGIFSFGREKK